MNKIEIPLITSRSEFVHFIHQLPMEEESEILFSGHRTVFTVLKTNRRVGMRFRYILYSSDSSALKSMYSAYSSNDNYVIFESLYNLVYFIYQFTGFLNGKTYLYDTLMLSEVEFQYGFVDGTVKKLMERGKFDKEIEEGYIRIVGEGKKYALFTREAVERYILSKFTYKSTDQF